MPDLGPLARDGVLRLCSAEAVEAALRARIGPADPPVVVVDLARAADGPPGGCVRLASRPWVVIGRSEQAAEAEVSDVDVVVEGDADLEAVLDASLRNPLAAIALVQLLRLQSRLAGADALVAESAVYGLLQAGPEHRRWLDGRVARPRRVPDRAPVAVERDGGLLRLVLDWPERRNAFGAEVRDALLDALDVACADDGIERVLLTGRGPSFCSGGDLDEFGTTPDPVTAHLVRTTRSVAAALLRLSPRLEVHVQGPCVGAGAELPAFAGRVLASSDATFRLPEVGMGLVPGAGGTVSLRRRIGRQRTALLALTGAELDASTALAWGLIDEIATG